jgi:copper chaperone
MVLGFNMPSMACATPARPNQELEMQHVFTVQGMTCGHCERAVTQAVQGVDDQARVRIDRAAQRVEVESASSREALVAAIAEEGYQVA